MQGTLAYNIIVGLIDYAQGNLLIDTCVKMLILFNPNISYKYTTFHTISHTTRFEEISHEQLISDVAITYHIQRIVDSLKGNVGCYCDSSYFHALDIGL